MASDPLKYIGAPRHYSPPVLATPAWGSSPAELAAYVISQVPGMSAEQQAFVQSQLASGGPLTTGGAYSPLSLEMQAAISQLQPFAQGATSQQPYGGNPIYGGPPVAPPISPTPVPPQFGPRTGGGGTVKQGGVSQPLPGPLDSLPASPMPHPPGGNVTWDEPYVPPRGGAIPYGGSQSFGTVQPYSPDMGPGAQIAETSLGVPSVPTSTNYDSPISHLRHPRLRIRLRNPI